MNASSSTQEISLYKYIIFSSPMMHLKIHIKSEKKVQHIESDMFNTIITTMTKGKTAWRERNCVA